MAVAVVVLVLLGQILLPLTGLNHLIMVEMGNHLV